MADVNAEMYDTLMKELDRVEKMNSTLKRVSVSQKNLTSEVKEVKEFVGYDLDAQEKNVIDKEKLPARLNAQEKLRYVNIGKQFTLGAGEEFLKIRLKIKFSEKMSTSKDTFLKGFEKIKSKVRGVKKGSGLWSKIFKVVAILGILAYVFRDKLAKKFPKTTNFFKDIITKILRGIGVLLGEVWNLLKECFSKSFIGLLRHLSNYTIPNTVSSFFNHTLPNILLRSWIQVLAMFSESALQRLSEMTGGKLVELSDDVVAGAEKGMEMELSAQADGELRQLRQFNNTLAGMHEDLYVTEIDENELRYYMDNLGMLSFSEQSELFKKTMTDIAKRALGDSSVTIEKLMADGLFNMNEFIELAKGIMALSGDKNEALVQLFNDMVGKTIDSSNLKLRAQVVDNYLGEHSSLFFAQMDAFIAHQEKMEAGGKKVQDKFREKREADAKSAKLIMEEEAKKVPAVNVNFYGAFDGAISKQLTEVFKSIDNFLKGDDSKMISYIRKGVVLLGTFYKSFFEKSLDVLFNTVKGVGELYLPAGGLAQSGGMTVLGSNNVILNVDLSDNITNSVGLTLDNLSLREHSILTEVTNTNKKLEELRVAVGNIDNLQAASQEYIDGKVGEINKGLSTAALAALNTKVDELGKTLAAIKDTLFGDRPSAENGNNVPLTLKGQ